MSVKETFFMLFFVFIAAKYVLPNIVKLIGTRTKSRIRHDYYIHRVPAADHPRPQIIEEAGWHPDEAPRQIISGAARRGETGRTGGSSFDDIIDFNYRD